MTSSDALAYTTPPATFHRWRGGGTANGVAVELTNLPPTRAGLAALPPTRSTHVRQSSATQLNASAATLPTLRASIAALVFAPLCAFAQQADTTSAPATPASMAGTSTAPAPAAQEPSSTPRRPGETTTGRPPAPTQPAPSTTPSAAVPPTAPLPGDAAGVTTPPAPSTTTTAPNPTAGDSPRVVLPASPAPGSAGGILQTILALALVLGLLAGMAWFLKRFGPRHGGGSANLRVVGALNIGGRERIMVVEVGDQWIVVGAAPGRVNALHTMPRQEGELAPIAAQGGIPATNFSDWLKKTIDKRNAT